MSEDITYCASLLCPQANICERSLGSKKPGIKSMADFYPGRDQSTGECEYYIPSEELSKLLELDKKWPY